MIRTALKSRKGIPFFCEKSEEEIAQDPYERYNPMVLRQSGIHLCDELWESYFLGDLMKEAFASLAQKGEDESRVVVELGCSVGRWIGEWALRNPNDRCYGLDFSYQMVKQADAYWNREQELVIDLSKFGFSMSHRLASQDGVGIGFGVAKGEDLPFQDASIDILMANFLLDRLQDMKAGLMEAYRCMKPGAKFWALSPLNFLRKSQWDQYYPPIKIVALLQNIGFSIIDWREDQRVLEPLDMHGNAVQWSCISFIVEK